MITLDYRIKSLKVENLMSGILTNDNYYFARTLTLFKNQWFKLVCAKKTEIQKILVFFVEKYTFLLKLKCEELYLKIILKQC